MLERKIIRDPAIDVQMAIVWNSRKIEGDAATHAQCFPDRKGRRLHMREIDGAMQVQISDDHHEMRCKSGVKLFECHVRHDGRNPLLQILSRIETKRFIQPRDINVGNVLEIEDVRGEHRTGIQFHSQNRGDNGPDRDAHKRVHAIEYHVFIQSSYRAEHSNSLDAAPGQDECI